MEQKNVERKRILVIEDDKLQRRVLRQVLERDGFAVEEAVNGQEGFQKATTGDFDLIITDIMMPKWDGFDAIRSIHTVKEDVKIIVLSAYLNEENKVEIEREKCVVAYMAKPYSINELSNLVKKHCQ